jgi:hypothetical protein
MHSCGMRRVTPLPRSKRHPSDYRDDIEHAEIAHLLSHLPERHPARVAYCSGAWEGANTLSLSRLVAGHRKLLDRLIEIYTAHAPDARLRPPPRL